MKKGEQNTIVTSYNRNFPRRNDRETMNFIGSPEIVIAFAWRNDFLNPINDDLIAGDGTTFKLNPPRISDEIPKEDSRRLKRYIYIRQMIQIL